MSEQKFHLHDQADPIDEAHVRGKFGSRLGFMLAAVGSAIGLGNIWGFPYKMGTSGGAVFLIVYLVCIIFVAAPAMLVELSLGRHGQTSPVGTYKKIAPGTPWFLNGFMGVMAGFVILSFYSVIAGWVIKYFIVGLGKGFSEFTAEHSEDVLRGLQVGLTEPLVYQALAMILTGVIIYMGIEKGIERAAKYLMPLLFVLLILIVVRSVTLKGAGAGLEFMFKPDFSKLNAQTVTSALSQAFFTLSVGMGAMLTYASYVSKDIHLGRSAIMIAGMDTGVAILAGLAIFPAVFAFGLEASGGPGLIFVTLPQIFAQMGFLGHLVGTAFFFLIFIAALTSMISILEPVVTWLVDDVNLKRHLATGLATTGAFLLGIPACLSASDKGVLGEYTVSLFGNELRFFDLLENLSINLMLPLGGLVACLFLLLGWKKRAAMEEVAGSEGNPDHWAIKLWYYTAITLAPVGIACVLVTWIYGFVNPTK